MNLQPVEPFSVWGDLQVRRDLVLGLVQDGPGPDEREISAYLRSGHYALPLMESTTDVVAGAFSVAGGSSLQTDGTWIWRADLSEYVDTYHVALPEPFVAHVRRSGHVIPSISAEQLGEIEASLTANRELWGDPSVT